MPYRVIKAKPPNLDLQKGVDRFGDLVLKLARAQNPDPALRRQEDGEAGRVP